jgi:hypothetical protein
LRSLCQVPLLGILHAHVRLSLCTMASVVDIVLLFLESSLFLNAIFIVCKSSVRITWESVHSLLGDPSPISLIFSIYLHLLKGCSNMHWDSKSLLPFVFNNQRYLLKQRWRSVMECHASAPPSPPPHVQQRQLGPASLSDLGKVLSLLSRRMPQGCNQLPWKLPCVNGQVCSLRLLIQKWWRESKTSCVLHFCLVSVYIFLWLDVYPCSSSGTQVLSSSPCVHFLNKAFHLQ